MQLHLRILALLLVFTAPVYAQNPPLNLPELEEWYSWPGAKGSHISYLPGFSDQGGMNAITQKREGDPTWFNRFAYDTTNQFSWNGGSYSVLQLDLNGDGIADYIDGEGRVYRGIEKNKPPVLVPSTAYDRAGGNNDIGDFNGDGFDDILMKNQGTTFRMLFGGRDLLHLQRTLVAMPPAEISARWTGIGAYLNEAGQGRFVSYRRSDFMEGFYLYGLIFEATPTDSIAVSLKMLSFIEENKTDKNQHIFEPITCGLYSNKTTNERLLLLGTSKGAVRVYSTVNDKFTFQLSRQSGVAPLYLLQGSIDGDSVQDIATLRTYNSITRMYIIPGSPLLGMEPRAVLGAASGGCDVTTSEVYYIGDVTGDGVGDVGVGDIHTGCFSIYKGIDWRKLSAADFPTTPNFTLHQSEPSPIGKDGLAVLPITLAHAGVYTLDVYDLTGKRIGELFHGELPSGEVRLPFDVKLLNVSSGMFALRLTNGKHTRERAIVIQR